MDNIYLITLFNEDTDEHETIEIIAYNAREMELVISRKPEYLVVANIQNIGSLVNATEFLQELTDNGNLNLGSN